MYRGEISEFIFEPQYGYGERGNMSRPKVHKNAKARNASSARAAATARADLAQRAAAARRSCGISSSSLRGDRR